MNQSMQPAIQHLFHVSGLEAVSRQQLETFVAEYPCFGFGHYLLSRKLRQENSDQFLLATQKTSLYFPNPFWLNWMLENTPEPAAAVISHRAEPEAATIPHPVEPETAATSEPEAMPIPDPVGPEAAATPEPEATTIPHPAEPAATPIPEPPIQDEEPPFILDEGAEPTPIEVHTDPEAPSSAAELLLESIEKAKALRESLQQINEVYQSHNGQPEPAAPAIAEAPAPPTPIIEAAPLADSPSPTATVETTPIFEPLHTIDYFASQGIRLTPEENPTDPLGRQLKSFTEWLRTMRRLPQKDREIIPDRVVEQSIQNFAAHSIEGKEPVTETMAEVLAKQGMPDRARIVYEKLSLLNPDKSAYFATKIEQLNSH